MCPLSIRQIGCELCLVLYIAYHSHFDEFDGVTKPSVFMKTLRFYCVYYSTDFVGRIRPMNPGLSTLKDICY